MTTSNTPQPRVVSRARLRELNESLLELHRALIATTRVDFEREHGRVSTSGELLGLLTDHEFFAWLRPLSSLVARLDSSPEDGAARASSFEDARALFEPASGAFADAHYALLQRAPEVIVAHGKVRASLDRAGS